MVTSGHTKNNFYTSQKWIASKIGRVADCDKGQLQRKSHGPLIKSKISPHLQRPPIQHMTRVMTYDKGSPPTFMLHFDHVVT